MLQCARLVESTDRMIPRFSVGEPALPKKAGAYNALVCSTLTSDFLTFIAIARDFSKIVDLTNKFKSQ